jgi:hypothetical protein
LASAAALPNSPFAALRKEELRDHSVRNTASGKHTLPQYSATHFSTESISHYTQYAQPPLPAGPAPVWGALPRTGSAPALRRTKRSAQPARSATVEPRPSDRYAGRTPTPRPNAAKGTHSAWRQNGFPSRSARRSACATCGPQRRAGPPLRRSDRRWGP